MAYTTGVGGGVGVGGSGVGVGGGVEVGGSGVGVGGMGGITVLRTDLCWIQQLNSPNLQKLARTLNGPHTHTVFHCRFKLLLMGN